jgi:glycosyltransferase involved in cell wall biosynthesis
VIAYAKGGCTETVIPLSSQIKETATGILFESQDIVCVIEAIRQFENNEREFNPHRIRNNALRFSRDNFKENIKNLIKEKIGAV